MVISPPALGSTDAFRVRFPTRHFGEMPWQIH
jgi:hypothetical protein